MSEPEGFRDYVAARSGALLRTAWLLTGDWGLAEDLLQTALAKTWPRWGSIERVDDPDVYVRRVMANTMATWWRRRRRVERLYAVPPEFPDRVDAVAAADSRDELRRLLANLPPRQRAVVVLRFVEDFSAEQTAVALGCSVGTVKSQTARALAKLRVGQPADVEEVGR